MKRYYYYYLAHLGWKVFFLLFLTIITSALDIVGITLFLPLLQLASSQGTASAGSDLNEIGTYFYILIETTRSISGSENKVVNVLLIILLVFILKGTVNLTLNYYNAWLRGELYGKVKLELIENVIGSEDRSVPERVGELVNVVVEQATKVVQCFYNFSQCITQILFAVGYMLIALILTPTFVLVAVVFGIVLLLFFRTLNKYVVKVSRDIVSTSAIFTDQLIRSFTAFKYLIVNRYKIQASEKIQISLKTLKNKQKLQWILTAITKNLQEPIAVIVLISGLIYDVAVNNTDVSSLIISTMLLYRGVNSLLVVQLSLQNTLDLVGALERVVDTSEEFLQGRKEIVARSNVRSEEFFIDVSGVSLIRDDRVILNEIKYKFVPGKIYVICGDSGSGKSTFLDLLIGWTQPSYGKISIGVGLNKAGRHIAYAPQKDNYVEKEMFSTIFVNGKPNNIETIFVQRTLASVGLTWSANEEDNRKVANLSGGELQRLMLVRELMKDPDILIMDELTSGLDTESEQKVMELLQNSKKGKIIILVSHNKLTRSYADITLQLKNKKLEEVYI